jgi:SAM-dependent methyltransferase
MGRGTRYQHVITTLNKHMEPSDKVLEIGCGGAVYKNIIEFYVGSDLGPTLYAEPGDVDVYCDGRTLPFPNDTFDLVFMVNCLMCIYPQTQALTECFRVLKPGGKVLVFDYNKLGSVWVKAQHEASGYAGHSSIWSPFQLRSLVASVGFKASVIYDYHGWTPSKGIKGFLKRSRVIQYIAFLYDQRKINYSVVLGKKPQRAGQQEGVR